MASFMLGSQFRESKIRNKSIPAWADSLRRLISDSFSMRFQLYMNCVNFIESQFPFFYGESPYAVPGVVGMRTPPHPVLVRYWFKLLEGWAVIFAQMGCYDLTVHTARPESKTATQGGGTPGAA